LSRRFQRFRSSISEVRCFTNSQQETFFDRVSLQSSIESMPRTDIYPKVEGDANGLFPFLLHLEQPIAGSVVSEMLRHQFQNGLWSIKPNTNFTPLRRNNIERATFQIGRRGNPEQGASSFRQTWSTITKQLTTHGFSLLS
jgi:virulence-associated protein VapD